MQQGKRERGGGRREREECYFCATPHVGEISKESISLPRRGGEAPGKKYKYRKEETRGIDSLLLERRRQLESELFPSDSSKDCFRYITTNLVHISASGRDATLTTLENLSRRRAAFVPSNSFRRVRPLTCIKSSLIKRRIRAAWRSGSNVSDEPARR